MKNYLENCVNEAPTLEVTLANIFSFNKSMQL